MLFFRHWLLTLILFCPSLPAQQTDSTNPPPSPWLMQTSGATASLRGLHVLNDKLVWASGTGGTVLRTVDGGEHWTVLNVAGAEELDFRDVHGFDENNALVSSAGTPARIYRTRDGGKTWQKTFEHPSEQAFFDAMSFWNQKDGILMSDPLDQRVLLLQTHDGGESWAEMESASRPTVTPGEAGFAASGTNMVLLPDGTCLVALGGAAENEHVPNSRILVSRDRGQTWSAVEAPLPRSQSSGIFSMAFANNLIGVAVGGDYLKPNESKGNVVATIDGGKTWYVPSGTPPTGYRSGVAANRSGKLLFFVAVGPNGTDWSTLNGRNWSRLSDDAFHAVQFSPTGNTGWASGADGRIGKWVKPPTP
jgi:photosystem II stability/assembly factor-like uncharacterized protein